MALKKSLLQVCAKTHRGNFQNWPCPSHFLLRVTHTESKRQWALDIGGAQFGIYQSFWDWEAYVREFVNTKTPMKVFYFGFCRDIMRDSGKLDGAYPMTIGLTEHVAEAMDAAVTTFERRHDLPFAELLRFTSDDFEVQKSALLNTINTAIDSYKTTNDREIRAKFEAAIDYERRNPGLANLRFHLVSDQYRLKNPFTIEEFPGSSG
jgi:hypothetical protein